MKPLPNIEQLRARLASEPHSLAFARLADAYRKAGSHEEAIRICEQGLSHCPNYASACMVLGRAHQESGNLLAAREAFQRVLQLDPESVRAYKFLGQIAEAHGDSREALAAYRMALILHPFDKEARAAVERLDTHPPEVPPAPPKVVATPPESAAKAVEPLATETLAGLYATQGLYERAADIYARLVAEAPDREDLTQKYRDVLAHLEQAAKRKPPASLATEEAIRLLEAWRDIFQKLRVKQQGTVGLLEAWRDVFRRLRVTGRSPLDILRAWRDVFQRLKATQ